MADIKDQLIKDSYNYVLQSDLSTGVVYRIGGSVPVNPIFSSGLTVNSGFTYSNGTEQSGYALLTDGTGYAYWGPVSGASPSSGVTSITVGGGLSANSSTGAVTIVFTGSTSTSGDYLPLSGGTVNGNTFFTSGLTANTLNVTGNTKLVNTSGTSFYTNYIDFNNSLTPLPSDVEGRMYWDEDNGTVSLIMHGAQVSQQIGLEQYYYVKNQSGATIENGRVVRAAGTLGSSGRLLGEYMIANGSILAKYTLGIATEDITNGEDGYVTEFGLVRGINTTGSLYGETWSDGTILWVSPTIPGGLTKFEPQSPNLKIEIAIVIKADNNGSMFVRPNRYPYMYDLQQVNYSAGTENNYDILQWGGSSWNKTNTPFFNGLTSTTISATTYYNYPGSSSSNCFGTFYTSSISGCSPVTILTPLNLTQGINVTGVTNFTNTVDFSSGLTASTISATTYQNLPVSGVTNGTGISSSTNNGVVTITNTQVQGITGKTDGDGISSSISNNVITITNTDLGSSQNIFKNIQVGGVTQFSAGSNSANLNFSGINITITSASTNTLVFSAGTGGSSTPFNGGIVSGPTIFTNGLTSNTLNVTGITTSLTFISSQSVGDEGGQIELSKSQTNTTLSGTTITIDIYQNKLRFFESGGDNRGAYIDLSAASSGVGSNLLTGGGGLTFQQVQMVAFLST